MMFRTLATPPVTRDPSPQKASRNEEHPGLGFARQALKDWDKIKELRSGSDCIIDGNSLDIAEVVAVAKYGTSVSLSQDAAIRDRINRSIDTLSRHLKSGHIVYGVTTGFGGSADSRTTDVEGLQKALIQHQNSGVLTSTDIRRKQETPSSNLSTDHDDFDAAFDTQSMPTTWVRASMLTRCNSLIRGHSAVRDVVAESILTLLRHDITPVIPLRGSISASGDLQPLSYIAGAIEGNPDIYVRVGKGNKNIITAQQALKEVGIAPITFRAKEGLGVTNGTAVSAATASLAIHQSQQLAVLCQILTAMSTEALAGTAESFWPKIAEMRPHPGQIETAGSILSFLANSKLAACVEGPKDTKAIGLYQDRYALRTSSQWMGPQIEDLHHAHEQLLVELNSTTDNPLIDIEADHILHGGNFQAAVVTSTMDRTRLALDKFGRMLFAQVIEMINPATNKGLPANLTSDDPSLSFTCKGIDINIAAYASELSFLANPVGNHVMSAEMHNQAINSLALISARYTFQALDIIRIMCATYLFTVCQALDLRVQQVRFLDELESKLCTLITQQFPESASPNLQSQLWTKFTETWPNTMTLDLSDRATKAIEALTPLLIARLSSHNELLAIRPFIALASSLVTTTYIFVQETLEQSRLAIVPTYLGDASRALYTFIRSRDGLGVGFHRGLIEHPAMPAPPHWTREEAEGRKTIGSRISVVYEALRDGRVSDVTMELVRTCLERK